MRTHQLENDTERAERMAERARTTARRPDRQCLRQESHSIVAFADAIRKYAGMLVQLFHGLSKEIWSVSVE